MNWKETIAALRRGRLPYLWASLLLVVPCYWQPRLQAGDLSSHIYNAWLAQLIESGRADGLLLVRQTTNVLFDLILSGLFRIFGAEGAQRVAVSISVLTFVWGAFAFMSRLSGRRPWHLFPCLAMLAYGWLFHMGFFNVYLSMGLCFGAMALAWPLARRNVPAVAALLIVAYLAHALPVVWTLGLITYSELARRLSAVRRAYLTAASVFAMFGANLVLGKLLVTRWSPRQFALSIGIDQVWVFDGKYYIVLAGLLAIWALLFLALLRWRGARDVISSVPFHLCVNGAAAVLILPSAIFVPGFAHALTYIAERMSLGVAVCVCALLGAVQPRVLERYGLMAVAVAFFGLVYHDERALNSFEDRMQDVVSMLPPGVVNCVQEEALRSSPVVHMIDRVCIGKCFSYANYEPSTRQFRIRVTGPNRIVASSYKESFQLQKGQYLVKRDDLPLYAVDIDSNGRFRIKLLKAGAFMGATDWGVLDNSPRPSS